MAKVNVKKSNNKLVLKDLDKIISDPRKYATDISVKRLITILKKMSDAYYTTADPIVGDDIFDQMVEVLNERDPDNVFLFQTGAPSTSRDDVSLPFGMPSLNKIKPGEKSLTKFFKNYLGPFIVSDKLDGISAQIYKDTNGVVDLFSKTHTMVGKSKKHLLKYLVSELALQSLPNGTSIRGEILISRKDFADFKKESNEDFKNTRNTMAGFVNTDTIDTRLAEKAQLVIYGIISPIMTMTEQIKKLNEWGFKTAWNRKLSIEDIASNLYDEDPDNKYASTNPDDDKVNDDKVNDDLDLYDLIEAKLEQILKYRRSESEFDCDGIVVTDDSKTYIYDNNSNPKHAMAFKKNIQSDMKVVTVDKVIWDPSMYGVLKPVLKIKPVNILGVTITYVTAHNAAYIRDNNIGSGSTVKISRSGDVIPYIEEVIKSNKVPDMPDIPYEWNDTDVDIIVIDSDEDTFGKIQIKRILHFFRTLGVKYLSEGIITNLYFNEFDSVLSILMAASKKDETTHDINGLGDKMMTKIYREIDRVMDKPDISKIMSGSLIFGMGMGSRKMRDLIKRVPDLLTKYSKSTAKNIKIRVLEVPGFSDISAEKIAHGLKDFVKFVKNIENNTSYELKFYKTTKTTKTTGSTDIDMSDQKITLTGFRDQDIIDFIEDMGGKVTSSVSGNTTMVVYKYVDGKSEKSSKLKKAEDLGIEILTNRDFIKKYNLPH
jgi:DNA ligase (NAD+)